MISYLEFQPSFMRCADRLAPYAPLFVQADKFLA
jgi:hypothetical protein